MKTKTGIRQFSLLFALPLLAANVLFAEPTLPQASPYARLPALEGELFIYGARSMSNELIYLADGFRQIYPKVSVQIESVSATITIFADGPRVGTDHLFMYDDFTFPADKRRLLALAGKKPIEVDLFGRAVHVLVSHNNPVEKIAVADLKRIFLEGGAEALKWDELGVPGRHPLSGQTIAAHSGSSDASSFTRLFRLKTHPTEPMGKWKPLAKSVLRSGTYETLMISLSGEQDMIALSPGASADFKVLAVASEPNGLAVKPPSVLDEARTGSQYPFLQISKLYSPTAAENQIHREFLKYALSPEGQKIMASVGFWTLPLTEKARLKELSKISN